MKTQTRVLKFPGSGPRVGVCAIVLLLFLWLAGPGAGRPGAEEGADDTSRRGQPPHPLQGVWRWNFPMPDGSVARPKLVLSVKGERLEGTSSLGPGTEVPITNAVLNGDRLRFQVVRRRENKAVVTTYAGQWSAREIRGSIESDWAGRAQVFDWLAQRAHPGLEGTWQWTNSFGRGGGEAAGPPRGGRGGFMVRVELEQSGEELTGTLALRRGGRRTEIKNGSVRNGKIRFEIERLVGDERLVTRYEGQQTGDTIHGTVELLSPDQEPRKMDWVARRAD